MLVDISGGDPWSDSLFFLAGLLGERRMVPNEGQNGLLNKITQFRWKIFEDPRLLPDYWNPCGDLLLCGGESKGERQESAADLGWRRRTCFSTVRVLLVAKSSQQYSYVPIEISTCYQTR